MANVNRGEVTITLEAKEYTLRPSFQNICSIENDLDKSIINVIANLTKNKLSIKDTSVIIFHALQSDEKHQLSKDMIGELIFNTGIINILPIIVKFLEYAVGIRGQNYGE